MSKLPPHDSFELTLSEQIEGEAVLENPKCHFSYHWDFEKNVGLAVLESIDQTNVNITLHPLGIEGQLDFMSDMPSTEYDIQVSSDKAVSVRINRVILDINEVTGEKAAAIMFNADGSSIQASPGFEQGSVAKSLPEVVYEAQEAPEDQNAE